MDFDDLREYAPGDDVRDIDWNATARSSATLVRRYRSERKQIVTFLVDTGRSMSAVTRRLEPKTQIVVDLVGTMAYLATKHGDDVGLLYGDARAPRRIEPGRSDAHLERILRAIGETPGPIAPRGDVGALLEHAARTIHRRMILICVTDEAPLDERTISLVRSLRARHEILWLSVGDTRLEVGRKFRSPIAYDVSTRRSLPAFLLSAHGVSAEASASRERESVARTDVLERAGVSNATIHSLAEVLPELIAMFSRRGYARG
ncbi:DUF58 domain-containing protein [Cryobacterium zhongshanensis]|uniref:DUF58 domain-containing protein n=1 Tax=Cryobacterium zhongshanensis TaxID=2928153 RepID=A0AA41UF41_9MICO|nr:DUF58 domain-containing protein [Cryobacterium zhongshanensis]MCI4657620.1 DUF58 domain-containing protein [Cryobacterium zhongshanensis]